MKVTALAAAVALAAALAMPAASQDRTNALQNGAAPMAETDPQLMIYRVADVRNTSDGGPAGAATVFFCYSNSSSNKVLRLRLFNYDGALVQSAAYQDQHFT